MRVLRTLAILVVSLLLAFSLSPVYAGSTSISTTADTVSGDGFCSLREAISDSNAGSNVSGDCTGIAGATNTLFITAGDYTLSSALPDITSNIMISKVGVGAVNIQANVAANTATYRIFLIASGGSLTLNTIIVRNGGDGSSAPSFGGCIFVNVNGTLIV